MDKVCGPGNIYVVLAKKMVYGAVGIDGLYGPSEVLIVADETANPALLRRRPAGPGGARRRGLGHSGDQLRGAWPTR